jgi:hypothetical protein
MQNNPLPDNFRSTLNHNQSIQNIRQYGCYNFYDYKKYGHTGGWYLYYLIDFRVGCGANDECVLPFYAEPGHVRSLCLPSDSKAISAAVYTLLEIPEDNNNNILLFMVNQKSACNEDDGGIFENILCWPLSQGCLSPNDLLLSQKSSIAVHSGSRTTGGYVVVTN